MHVLCISRAYGQDQGGMERLSYDLTTHLAKEPNTTVTVIAYKGSRIFSPLFNLICLPKALSKAPKADVIHLGDPMLAFVGWFIKLLYRKPVAITVHGLDILYPNPLYQLYLKLFFSNFDLYLPISGHVSNLLNPLINHGQMFTLNPGITDAHYDPTLNRQDLDKVLNRDTQDNVVLFTAGRLVKRKGHAWFIANVFPSLQKNSLYVISGTGPETANIIAAAETAKVADRVLLLGRVSDKVLKILYNTADAFIQPNIPVKGDVEGFGLVLLEAALCGQTVFTSKLEGMIDAIQEGVNGYVIPAEGSSRWIGTLRGYIDNPMPLKQAREYTLGKYSWSKISPQFRTILQTLVGK